MIDSHKSEEADTVSGVLQGSVLDPLLFLIHMGDIGRRMVDSTLSSFADNTSGSWTITCTGDVAHQQQDLNLVYDWATRSNIQFNEDKFELLRHGVTQNIKEETNLTTEG